MEVQLCQAGTLPFSVNAPYQNEWVWAGPISLGEPRDRPRLFWGAYLISAPQQGRADSLSSLREEGPHAVRLCH